MNETMVTVAGRIISDPMRRRVGDGNELVSFRLASNQRKYDKVLQEWVDGDSLYLNVTCWRRLALGVAASLNKGDPVLVQGKLYTKSYEVDGQRRSSVEVTAYAVGPDLSHCTAEVQRFRPELVAVDGPVPSPERAEPVAVAA
jgi:single-strand DNA-binding protein